jgi:hypothetical protein
MEVVVAALDKSEAQQPQPTLAMVETEFRHPLRVRQ